MDKRPIDSPAGWSSPTTQVVRGVDARVSGPVSVPVARASTIVFSDVHSYENRHAGFYDRVVYGLYGTETSLALAADVANLEGGGRTVITTSGTAAITLSLMSCVRSGDHVLVADCVYGSTRRFCDDVLARFGVEVEYFDPLAGAAAERHFRRNTAALYLESPGSQTFEVSDVPLLAALARRHRVISLMDNTWATPLLFRPLDAGVDISIQSATKYLSGHSDAMLGTITMRDAALHMRVKDTAGRFGDHASPDDCYLVHRGLRTLDVRMRRHESNAHRLIEWLRTRPEVVRILSPAVDSDPGHAVWKRDYRGASGLFGVVLDSRLEAVRDKLFSGLSLFRLGSSWGGFESLMVPSAPAPVRRHRPAPKDGFLVRIHAGLEDAADLIADLDAAFECAARHDGSAARLDDEPTPA